MEDELVAQQMQQALELKNGNLDMGDKNLKSIDDLEGNERSEEEENDDEDFDDWYDLWNEDSV